MRRLRAFNFGYMTKYRILIVGSCLIVYKRTKDKYQKWLFRAILKDDTDKYYEFASLELEDADVRIFDISNCVNKNMTLIIHDKKIVSTLKFKVVKHYNKYWIVLNDNENQEI